MRLLTIFAVLLAAVALFYGGLSYSQFHLTLNRAQRNFQEKEYTKGIKTIEAAEKEKWFWLYKRYPDIDYLEFAGQLSYQKARLMIELGQLKESYALLNSCIKSKDSPLAAQCLYQQGNIALYQGNLNTAETKWQESLKKDHGGHDFDTQVNLELLKNEKQKAMAMAMAAMQTHRRSNDREYFHRPPGKKGGEIKP